MRLGSFANVMGKPPSSVQGSWASCSYGARSRVAAALGSQPSSASAHLRSASQGAVPFVGTQPTEAVLRKWAAWWWGEMGPAKPGPAPRVLFHPCSSWSPSDVTSLVEAAAEGPRA